MTDKFVTALNTMTGVVAVIPARYLAHPHFKNWYVQVEEGAKSYVPELYNPKTADEFIEAHGSPGEETEPDDPQVFDDILDNYDEES